MLPIVTILVLGLMFLGSGLIINFFQALAAGLLLPLSRNLYRRANAVLVDLYWAQLVWLTEWWGGVEVRLYTSPEVWELMGKEHSLLLCNHRSDIDWVVGWVLAQRRGCLGGTRALMKKSLQYLPAIGWSLWFSEYLFLARNWSKDENLIKRGFERLRGFPGTMWMALFVEGTRFTPAKLQASQEYAASAGLPIPQHTLVPRTKGFVSAVQNLRSFVPALYNMTQIVPQGVPTPTFAGLLKRERSVVHVYIERFLMKDLPQDDEGLAAWCRTTWVAKDKFLAQHIENNTFGEELYLPIKRSVAPLLISAAWALLLSAMLGSVLWWATWHYALNGISLAVAAVVLLGIALVLQWLLSSTQSERGTPASRPRSAPRKPHSS